MPEIYRFLLFNAFNRTSLNITSQDFLSRDPNEFYQGADLAWMMMATALVLLMIPGIGLFYSGSSEKSSAISMLWFSMMTTSIIGLQWWLWGYSIAFTGSNKFWGGPGSIALHNDLSVPWGNKPGTKIPQMVYALFQGMFACFTGAIISGAAIRKGDPLHFLVFIFIWSTFVYAPIARSTWNPIGWANYWKGGESGVFDFAGGTAVHLVAASTAGVYSIFCKWKRQISRQTRLTEEQIKKTLMRDSKPYNAINVMLGTAFLYVGWFGFNGGSALGANLRAVSACLSTHLAACAGGLMGTGLEYLAAWKHKDKGRFSVIGFCNGVLTGLVAITPAAGYVPYWSAPIFGIVGSVLCFLAEDYCDKFLDIHHILVMHGVAGFTGMMLTTAFASANVAKLDGYTVIVNRRWEQLGIQLSDVLANTLYSAVGTLSILIFMEMIIVFYRKLRKIPKPEIMILDSNIIVEREIGDDFRYELQDIPNGSSGAGGGGAPTQPDGGGSGGGPSS